MQILYGKEYLRQLNPKRSSLQLSEIDQCDDAVLKFTQNPRLPSLKFKRLKGGPRKNHWSIRGSGELRVILAVELRNNEPYRIAAVNMGHHDVYEWSARQGYRTDLDGPSLVVRASAGSAGSANESELAAGALADFEDWMLFLPIKYRHLVRRSHKGAARIRGAAGTGKTVIALHRAAMLGRKYAGKEILVTTFSRSLCNHMEALFRRMPDPPSNVKFRNIDRLAYEHSGAKTRIEVPEVEQAFHDAFRAAVGDSDRARLGEQYLREEIRRVIKGRDAKKEEYLDTGRFERIGRIRSFKKRDREICWRLREEWDRLMQVRGLTSFEDRLVEARNRIWETGEARYRSAIVDEGQDMTLVGAQFVRALVAGKPEAELPLNGLLMLDDTAQRIYAGGYRPKWAGLTYTGRSNAIRTNFRNSQPIFEAARAVRGGTLIGRDANDDGAIEPVDFDRTDGARPTLLITKNREARAIMDKIRELVSDSHFKHEEIGVFARNNRDAKALEDCFKKYGIPCDNLKRLKTKRLQTGVRVGTFDRAKGLEFRAVFIARLGRSRFPIEEKPHDGGQARQEVLQVAAEAGELLTDEAKEVRQLDMDRLYAAMTRARELLYLVADETPCKEIKRVEDRFRLEQI